jgi:hypothetical protein
MTEPGAGTGERRARLSRKCVRNAFGMLTAVETTAAHPRNSQKWLFRSDDPSS